MIEGLWTGEWETVSESLQTEIQGAGVFYFREGRCYGGNAWYYYSGSYKQQGSSISVVIDFFHYSGKRLEILGEIKEGQIGFSGEVQESTMELGGELVGPKTVLFRAKLTKRGSP